MIFLQLFSSAGVSTLGGFGLPESQCCRDDGVLTLRKSCAWLSPVRVANSQQRFCWVLICGVGSGARKMHGPENRNAAGTLLKHSWKLAGTVLEPCGKFAATLQEPLAGISVETLAGVVFVFVYSVLLWLMCRVVMLEIWLELCWSPFAALPEPIWRQLLNFLRGLFCLYFSFELFPALLNVLGCFRLGGAGRTIEDGDPFLKLWCWNPYLWALQKPFAGAVAGFFLLNFPNSEPVFIVMFSRSIIEATLYCYAFALHASGPFLVVAESR